MTLSHNKLSLELAQLAKLAYQKRFQNEPILTKWQLLKESTPSLDGYKGYVFTNGKINVLIHRGTDELVDSFSNLQLYLKEIPLQLVSASMFALSVGNQFGKIHLHAGHSLGGAIAQLIAINTKASAVAFDSPGVAQLAHKINAKSSNNFENIIEYLGAPNFINTQDVHVGNLYRVFIGTKNQVIVDDYIQYSLNQHSLDNIIDALNNNPVRAVNEWPKGFTSGYREYVKHNVHPASISDVQLVEEIDIGLNEFITAVKSSEYYTSLVVPVIDSLTTLFNVNTWTINQAEELRDIFSGDKKALCTNLDIEQRHTCEDLVMLVENIFVNLHVS
jgi:hypothetical protein